MVEKISGTKTEREAIRQALLVELAQLTQEQMAALLHVARTMRPGHPGPVSENIVRYDEAEDPAIGLMSGPADFAERAEEILADEINPRSGWTRKEPGA
jgi:hypothetical protein